MRATRWNAASDYVDLETLPGHMNSWVIAMNDRDVIIGQSAGDTSSSGVFWDQSGRVHTLPPLPDDTAAFPMAINNKDSIAGGSWRPNLSRAVVWHHIA